MNKQIKEETLDVVKEKVLFITSIGLAFIVVACLIVYGG